jgi:hypothetical protein
MACAPGLRVIVADGRWIFPRAAMMMWMPNMPSCRPRLLRVSSWWEWIVAWCWMMVSGLISCPSFIDQCMCICDCCGLAEHDAVAAMHCP